MPLERIVAYLREVELSAIRAGAPLGYEAQEWWWERDPNVCDGCWDSGGHNDPLRQLRQRGLQLVRLQCVLGLRTRWWS